MKFLFILLSAVLLFTSQSFAKKPEHAKSKKEKHVKKSKNLPYGLQKKINKGADLPPGWKKKITVGKVVSRDILSKGIIINPKELGLKIPDTTYSKIYKIQDKIIRINNATNVILDVLK